MHVSLCAAMPFLLAAALASPAAAETWEKTYDVSGEPTLALRTNDGNVEVSTWSKKSIGVRVVATGWHLGSRGVNVEEHQTGDRVDVEVRMPSWGISFTFGHTVRIEVMMPARATLDVHTGDGAVSVQPLAGTIRVHTGDGAITVAGLKGGISLEDRERHRSTTRLHCPLPVDRGVRHLKVTGR